MRHIQIIVSLLVIALATNSCVSVDAVTHRYQLENSDSTQSLSVLTRDGSIYRLKEYSLEGASLRGRGMRDALGRELPYEGVLSLDDIEYAQVERRSADGSIFAIGVAAVVAGAVVAAMLREEKSEIFTYQREEGESCPYVYSWNGEEHVLEAETFGTSLGKSLQRETRHVLPSLREENGEVRLRIRNERPETHYLDRVALRRVLHQPGTGIVMDTRGEAWQVGELQSAAERLSSDGTGQEHTFRFRRPPGATRALLVVTAINREMTGGIFQQTFSYLGGDALRFVRDLERDPETVSRLTEWLQRCGLQVSIGEGSTARVVGAIDPEGTAIPFTRAMEFDAGCIDGDELAVTLQALPGLWEVQDARIAWDAVGGLESTPLTLQECIGPANHDERRTLTEEDGEYCTLLPPQAVDFTFAVPPTDAGLAQSYVIEAAGYLHLWYGGEDAQPGLFAAFERIPLNERRTFVREMMGRPELVLPMLQQLTKK
jgi:hypothetical protein